MRLSTLLQEIAPAIATLLAWDFGAQDLLLCVMDKAPSWPWNLSKKA